MVEEVSAAMPRTFYDNTIGRSVATKKMVLNFIATSILPDTSFDYLVQRLRA